MTTTLTPAQENALVGAFDAERLADLCAAEPALLREKRRAAFDQYAALPLPTGRDEEYRRTDPSRFKLERYTPPALLPERPAGPAGPWDEEYDVLIEIDATGYAIRDRGAAADRGVTVCSLAEAAERCPDLVQAYLNGAAQPEQARKYLALNGAFWNVGFFVHLPRGVELEGGILIRTTQSEADGMLLPRLVLAAEENAACTLVEDLNSPDGVAHACLSGREAYLDPASRVKVITLQEWGDRAVHLGEDWARVRRDATVELFTLTLGGRLSKISVGCNVCEPRANAYLGGLYFAGHKQHFDQKTLQLHSAPDTYSNMLYKGAAQQHGYSVYQGIIQAMHGAIGVDAYQTNNNLLLDATGRTDSLPGLIINADDLACSHGATMGRLDPDQIYYLRSRGIPDAIARRMLVNGFFDEMIDRLPGRAIKDRLHDILDRKLGGEA